MSQQDKADYIRFKHTLSSPPTQIEYSATIKSCLNPLSEPKEECLSFHNTGYVCMMMKAYEYLWLLFPNLWEMFKDGYELNTSFIKLQGPKSCVRSGLGQWSTHVRNPTTKNVVTLKSHIWMLNGTISYIVEEKLDVVESNLNSTSRERPEDGSSHIPLPIQSEGV